MQFTCNEREMILSVTTSSTSWSYKVVHDGVVTFNVFAPLSFHWIIP